MVDIEGLKEELTPTDDQKLYDIEEATAASLMDYFCWRAYSCLAVPREQYHSGGAVFESKSPVPPSVESYLVHESAIRKMVGEVGWKLLIAAYHPESPQFGRGKEPPIEGADPYVPRWKEINTIYFGTRGKNWKTTPAEILIRSCLRRIAGKITPHKFGA